MTSTFATVQVKFLRPYKSYKFGQIVSVSQGVAKSLESMRLAEPFIELQLELAVASVAARLETALDPMAKAPRRRRATT